MPSYDVKSGDKTTLAVKINSTQTTAIKFAHMNINGVSTAVANTAGVWEISEQSDSTLKREWIYCTGGSVDASNDFTPSGVVRGIARDSTDVTIGGTGIAFSKGAVVRFVTFHDLLNKKANVDRANTFSATQLLGESVQLQFDDSGTAIYDDGTDLIFKDSNNPPVKLSTLAAAAGTDTKTRVSANDTTSGFLNGKLVVANGITFTENNDGSNETLSIGTNIATDPALEYSSNALRVKIKSGGGIVRDSNGLSGGVPTGAVMQWATKIAPTDWLMCYGQTVSRTTYASLFSAIVPTIGTPTVTLASPGVFSLTSHGLQEGDAVFLTTSGALPTGLAINTLYYVISGGLTANAFELSATRGGSAINTSVSQSGTHTLWLCPYGLGDGSTTFGLPDFRGRMPLGWNVMGGTRSTRLTSPFGEAIGEDVEGAETVTLTSAQIPSHTHPQNSPNETAGTSPQVPWVMTGTAGSDTGAQISINSTGNASKARVTTSANTGGGGAHVNMPPYTTINYIIRT